MVHQDYKEKDWKHKKKVPIYQEHQGVDTQMEPCQVPHMENIMVHQEKFKKYQKKVPIYQEQDM